MNAPTAATVLNGTGGRLTNRHATETTANRIAEDLENVAAAVAVGDLAPYREDGYELDQWLADHPDPSDRALRHLVYEACHTSLPYLAGNFDRR